MSVVLLLALALYLGGLFFNLTAIIGVIRLPDVYCRLHSSAKSSTLGSLLILAGLAVRELQAGAARSTVKLLLVAAVLIVVAPIGSDALARSAYVNGAPLAEETVCDQYREHRDGAEKKGGTNDSAG